MADSLDIFTPVMNVLRNLTAGDQTVSRVYRFGNEISQTLDTYSWRVGMGDREIDSHVGDTKKGRYRESITVVCDYYVDTVAEGQDERIDEAREMQDAAIASFRSGNLVLARGIIVSEISPTGVGTAPVGNDVWAVSQVQIRATRWVDTGVG